MTNKAYYIIRPANRDLTAAERAAIHAYSQKNNISVRVVKEASADSKIITKEDLFEKEDNTDVNPKRQRKTTVKKEG